MSTSVQKCYYRQDLNAIQRMMLPIWMDQCSFTKGLDVLLGNKKEDGKFFVPMHCPLDSNTFDSLEKTKKLAKKYLSIPLIIKRPNFLFTIDHIVHVLIKREDKSETIEFFDSKGYPLKDYPEVQEVIDKLFKTATLLEHKKPTQSFFDPINCGAYLLSYLQQRIVQELPLSENVEKPAGGIFRFRMNLGQKMSEALAIVPEDPKIPDDWELVDNDDTEKP